MPAGILFLIFILTIWNPANLALQAASTSANIRSRSTLSLVFLVARLLITSVGRGRGHRALAAAARRGIWLAKLALALFAIEAGRAAVDARRRLAARLPARACRSRSSSSRTTRRGSSIFDYPVASARFMA